MDFELGLINAVIENGYPAYLETHISNEMLSADAQKVFCFIAEYWNDYGNTPPKELVSRRFQMRFDNVPEGAVDFWANEIIKSYLWKYNKTNAEKIVEALTIGADAGSISESVDIAGNIVSKYNQLHSGMLGLEDVYDPHYFEETIKEIWEGVPYIETPWQQLNEKVQGGWKPEELAIIAARPGVGKSMVLLMNCHSAWKSGKKVLLVSTEMSQKQMMMRMIYFAGIYPSLGRLRRGMFPENIKNTIKRKLEHIKETDGHNIKMLVDQKGINVSLESIDAQISIFKPDLVAIDGAYLLKSKTIKDKDKFGRVAEIFDRLKSMARRNKVAIISTTQLNRGSGQQKGGKFDLDRMAFSDNLGMVADYVFFLNQDENCKRDKILKIECGKLREGDDFDDIVLNWNFDANDFTEQPKKIETKTPVPVSPPKNVSFEKKKKSSYGGIGKGFTPPDEE